MPERIDFNTSFSFNLAIVPSTFNYGSADFDSLLHIPKLDEIQLLVKSNQPSLSKIIEYSGINKKDLPAHHTAFMKIKQTIFIKLEHVFAKNEKMLEIIYVIKKNYE